MLSALIIRTSYQLALFWMLITNLAVASDLVARARKIQADVLSQNLVHFGAVGVFPGKEKKPAIVSNCQPKGYKYARQDSNLRPTD